MGLNHPVDLDEWRRWQRSRTRLRSARAALRRTPPPELALLTRASAPDPVVLFALDATTPTGVAAVTAPIRDLGDTPVAVVAPRDVAHLLPGRWVVEHLGHVPKRPDGDATMPPRGLGDVRVVVAAGHYLHVGAAAYAWALQRGAAFVVVQHGLLTPFAPPLPRGSHVLAFTERDGRFWASGRTDVHVETVGSQLLWDAAHTTTPLDAEAKPVFLGQLHGAELARRVSVRTAASFCRRTGAAYRPHPAETDLVSRLQHERWRRAGIGFAAPGDLRDQGRPVVSIFSTGVLEAAAAGVPAWVTCVAPPPWVAEFWERYGLAPWGGPPTSPPPLPAIRPGLAVAGRVSAIVKERA